LRGWRFDVHRPVVAEPHHLGDAAGVVLVSLDRARGRGRDDVQAAAVASATIERGRGDPAALFASAAAQLPPPKRQRFISGSIPVRVRTPIDRRVTG
jgi:hypothetical protein